MPYTQRFPIQAPILVNKLFERVLFQHGNHQLSEKYIHQSGSLARYNTGYLNNTLREGDRASLSSLWLPTGGVAGNEAGDPQSLLIRAGFLRQAYSGIFHMLPLGLRVQDKLEALIDKHMGSVGASKLALSSISSEELWAKTNRLTTVGSELFRFADRRNGKYLLAPTHEEEITSLIANTVKSYKDLPIRLYQISRKYRDELRPRHGILRTREFVMKDLYTFDYTTSMALETYQQVRKAYESFFNDLKIPYLVAEADSGDMGGNLSHEFHFPTLKGEDNVINCAECGYTANEELVKISAWQETIEGEEMLASSRDLEIKDQEYSTSLCVWRGISHDRTTLINAWFTSTKPFSNQDKTEVNIHAIKALVPDLDASIDDPVLFWASETPGHLPGSTLALQSTNRRRVINLVDFRLSQSTRAGIESHDPRIVFWPESAKVPIAGVDMMSMSLDPITSQMLNLLRVKDGDSCPRCSTGSMKVYKAIELGHIFHLGTRYSVPLKAVISMPSNSVEHNEGHKNQSRVIPMQMGCHGIGVTRMIGAVAESLADSKGLNWPRIIAPYEAVIVSAKGLDEAAAEVYDVLCAPIAHPDGYTRLDIVIDDRAESFAWKMNDADLVGYPVIIIVGRDWESERGCEVQCRRLSIRQVLPLEKVRSFVEALLNQL